MKYQLKNEKYPVRETVSESTCEQPVDLDFTLPDYCPDIEKILKCRICPFVTSKSVSGDKLNVDGGAVIRLYYLDSKKQAIRICEHTSPFSCSFKLKDQCSEPTAKVKIRTEYINCRALSPRRLDIHGAFTVCVCVYDKTYAEYCTAAEGSDIQQLDRKENICTLCGISGQQFSLSEVLDIGKGKGSPESILRSELAVSTGGCRAVEDKLMLKGEAVLRILYVTDIETGAQDTMTFQIPLSQVIDVPGINETTQNEINVEVMNYDVSLKSEFDENSTLITLDAKLYAIVCAYENKEISVADDVYSTEYETEIIRKQTNFTRLVLISDERISLETEVNVSDKGITKIIDIWSDNISCVSVYENNTLTVRGKINCGIFGLDSDSVPFYAERAVEFTANPNVPANLREVSADITLLPELSFRITDNSNICIKSDIAMNITLFEKHSGKTVSEVSSDEDRPRKKDSDAALILYYPDENESLWSIAKKYCTDVSTLRSENNIDSNVAPSDHLNVKLLRIVS